MSSPYQPRRLALADEFWFLSHRDFGPGSFLNDGALGIGLAGALLAELTLAGYVLLQAGRVVPTERPPEPGMGMGMGMGGGGGYPRHSVDSPRMPPPRRPGIDPVHGLMMGEIAARPAWYPVADWIAFLATDAEKRVAGRMEEAGLLNAVGGLLRRRTWEPVDASTASSPAVALRYRARAQQMSRELVDPQTAMLAGLALATNLVRDIDVDDMTNLQAALLDMVNSLPDDMLTILRAVQESVTAVTRQIRR
jgi:hypothetical protein